MRDADSVLFEVRDLLGCPEGECILKHAKKIRAHFIDSLLDYEERAENYQPNAFIQEMRALIRPRPEEEA